MDTFIYAVAVAALVEAFAQYRINRCRERWVDFTRSVVKGVNTMHDAGKPCTITQLMFDGVVIVNKENEASDG